MNLNEAEKEKIKRFVNDEVMRETVKKVQEHFLKKISSYEVNYLAAQMLALDILELSYRELQGIAQVEDKTIKKESNPAL